METGKIMQVQHYGIILFSVAHDQTIVRSGLVYNGSEQKYI